MEHGPRAYDPLATPLRRCRLFAMSLISSFYTAGLSLIVRTDRTIKQPAWRAQRWPWSVVTRQ